jgi:hypothetical protein
MNRLNDMPAFPIPESRRLVPELGMSLRDYFAAKAMQSQIQCGDFIARQHTACWAYEMADAMLAERDKK